LGRLAERRASAACGGGGFEVFLTGDQSLQFQQNFARARLGVVVLAASSNRLEDLLPFVARAIEAISRSQPGEVMRITQ